MIWNPIYRAYNVPIRPYPQNSDLFYRHFFYLSNSENVTMIIAVAEWVRAWDTLTMFEATVCGRS